MAKAAIPGGTLDPNLVPKYAAPLVIPPAMPRSSKVKVRGAKNIDYYQIAARQFQQQILPAGYPATTVWSYGSVDFPGTAAQGGSFNYPAFTIEAKYNKPVRVKWINDLVDANGNFLPHLLPVDPTLHWANPAGGVAGRDMRPMFEALPDLYTGPVPQVTHVHGAHTGDESDGYAEAWYLPAAADIPADYASDGTWYNFFRSKFTTKYGADWTPGSSTFQYPNDQRATTLWYHDHTLGMTRLNVYAGPAGFYLLRGGPADSVRGMLPGPAPALGDRPGTRYYEIPIAIQDRSFNEDGSLYYPDSRVFFEGLEPDQLQIPYIGETACDGMPSDIAPYWNPEFFGNTMVVNGGTWPYLDVERRRYRFRFLNGCNSRFLMLQMDNNMPFYQIGADGGFLPAPVMLNQLLMSPAERADVIVDFSNIPVGTTITLINVAPDEPFGGGIPGIDFTPADPLTTGQVMQFRVGPALRHDRSTPPMKLGLPARIPLPAPALTRQVSLNEMDSHTVNVITDANGNVLLSCDDPTAQPFGPKEALLGTLNPDMSPAPMLWMDAISENPAVGDTEIWEIHNFTMDAHPIHIHQVMFEVLDRKDMHGMVRPAEAWETGPKDTVIAYPDEVTRIKAKFDLPGQYVWHCHIVEHEDNEMMRPFSVGPQQMPM